MWPPPPRATWLDMWPCDPWWAASLHTCPCGPPWVAPLDTWPCDPPWATPLDMTCYKLPRRDWQVASRHWERRANLLHMGCWCNSGSSHDPRLKLPGWFLKKFPLIRYRGTSKGCISSSHVYSATLIITVVTGTDPCRHDNIPLRVSAAILVLSHWSMLCLSSRWFYSSLRKQGQPALEQLGW